MWWTVSSVGRLDTTAATGCTAAATSRVPSSSIALTARSVALEPATPAAGNAATAAVVSTTVGASLRPTWLNSDALALYNDGARLDGGLAASNRPELDKGAVLMLISGMQEEHKNSPSGYGDLPSSG